MKDKNIIQNYINNFRRRLSPYIKPNVGLSCKIFPSEHGGAILEFTIGKGISNDDSYQDISNTVGQSLGKIDQKAFGGNLDGFVFSGTNVILENNRIIFIKGDELDVWTDTAAEVDVKRLISKPPGRPQ